MIVFRTTFELENSTCVADVCFINRTWTTLLSVIATTRIWAQATRAQPVVRCALDSSSEIPNKRSFVCQKVFCEEPSLSVRLCHFQQQNMVSESIVDVYIDKTEEGSCMVSGPSGSPIVGDPAIWTRTTHD